MYVAPPPDDRKLLDEPERLLAALDAADVVGRPSGYVHWDKLRHLTPPEGLTHEDWWFAITIRRSLGSLPLRDSAGKPFMYGVPSSIQRLLHFVDQHCGGEIAMSEVVPTDEQARHHYLVSSLMEEAIRSSQLEGATTSRQVAKELLRTGRAPRDRSELMILNNYRALEFMRDGMGEVLTPELVMTLQKILTEGTLDDAGAAGRLQTADEERVVVLDATDGTLIHTPPPADPLRERMDAMCAFANGHDDDTEGFIHPVVRGILLHFWLAYDHPFLDGNGRTARALFYWFMRSGTAPVRRLEHRDPPQREPALDLRLDRQLLAHLGLDLQLPLGVALLLAPGPGHERVPVAALVVVDEVDPARPWRRRRRTRRTAGARRTRPSRSRSRPR